MAMDPCEMSRAVGRIEGKVDLILDKLKDGDARHEKAERRIGKVERKVHWYSGALAVVVGVFGCVAKGT